MIALLREAREFGRSGRSLEAMQCYSRTLALEPDIAEALHFIGVLEAELTLDYQKSLSWIDRALHLVRTTPYFLTNKAIILQRVQRFDEALTCLEEALRLDSMFALAILNCGHVYRSKKKFEKAINFYEKVVALLPSDLAAYEHLSFCYSYPEGLELRCRVLERARFIDPANADVGFSLGAYYLLSGNFSEGWDLFENRWCASHVRDDPRYSKPLRLIVPAFDPSAPIGPVFIWSEQGVGDEIMFSSLITEFIDKFGVSVILQVDSRLEPVLARSLPGISVIQKGVSLPAELYRAHLPSGDLPRLLRRTKDSFSGGTGCFLVADTDRVRTLSSRLSASGKPVVGLSWHSSNGETRCIPLLEVVSLLRCYDVSIVNLQYGNHSVEIQSVEDIVGGAFFEDTGVDCQNDLDGLLALMKCCDIVISVGNATVHLAGAAGVPTLALLPHFPGWRWLSHGDRSLWYRSVKLFRQGQPGDWASVINLIDAELANRFSRV
jgi:Tfp pilus assembly protein PilF